MTHTNLERLATSISTSLAKSMQYAVEQDLHPQTVQKHRWLLVSFNQYTQGVASLLANNDLAYAQLQHRHQSLHTDTTKLVWLCSLFTNPNDVFEYPLAFFQYLHKAKQAGGFNYDPRTFAQSIADLHFTWKLKTIELGQPQAWAELQKMYA